VFLLDLNYHVEPFIHSEITLRVLSPITELMGITPLQNNTNTNTTNITITNVNINNDDNNNNINTNDNKSKVGEKKWDSIHSQMNAKERLNYYNGIFANLHIEFVIRYHACELPDFIVLARSLTLLYEFLFL
jgi:DUF971 family protein